VDSSPTRLLHCDRRGRAVSASGDPGGAARAVVLLRNTPSRAERGRWGRPSGTAAVRVLRSPRHDIRHACGLDVLLPTRAEPGLCHRFPPGGRRIQPFGRHIHRCPTTNGIGKAQGAGRRPTGDEPDDRAWQERSPVAGSRWSGTHKATLSCRQ
jgi:hypothetical protein